MNLFTSKLIEVCKQSNFKDEVIDYIVTSEIKCQSDCLLNHFDEVEFKLRCDDINSLINEIIDQWITYLEESQTTEFRKI